MDAREEVRRYLQAERENLRATLDDLVVVPYPATEEQIALYLRGSTSSDAAWAACVQFVERYASDNRPLPPPLADFILEILRGNLTRPSKPGRSRGTNLGRDLIVAEAVRIACTAAPELKATRYHGAEHESACDIVVESLKEVDWFLSYDAVAKIWQQRDRSHG